MIKAIPVNDRIKFKQYIQWFNYNKCKKKKTETKENINFRLNVSIFQGHISFTYIHPH